MAALMILQVAGYKNSGKTTLTSNLLELAVRQGLKVSVIKHHGHGGAPDAGPATTDSGKLFEQGALSSLAYGDDVVQLQLRSPKSRLEDFIALSARFRPDLILIEGFKQEAQSKIVMLRSSEDWEELRELSHIELVISPDDDVLSKVKGVEAIKRSDEAAIEQWFMRWIAAHS